MCSRCLRQFVGFCIFGLSFDKESSLSSDLVSCLISNGSLKLSLTSTRLNGLDCVYSPKRSVSCKNATEIPLNSFLFIQTFPLTALLFDDDLNERAC